jgi:arginase family enzyme
MQALELLRACRGLHIVGADVVEVVPDLDASYLTATLAATVAWEILSLIAVSMVATAGVHRRPCE